jgi:hypothetical protein
LKSRAARGNNKPDPDNRADHTNRVGKVLSMSDHGKTVWQEHPAVSNVMNVSMQTGAGQHQPLRYVGQYYDVDSALVYHGARERRRSQMHNREHQISNPVVYSDPYNDFLALDAASRTSGHPTRPVISASKRKKAAQVRGSLTSISIPPKFPPSFIAELAERT